MNISDTIVELSKEHDLTMLSKDSLVSHEVVVVTGHSKCALLCEAINALERGKQA